MSISVQLEASNDHVVSYLNKLWNDDKPEVPNNNKPVSNDDIGKVQTKSIIQQLIDSKILNVSVNTEPTTENLAEPKTEEKIQLIKPDDFLPVEENIDPLLIIDSSSLISLGNFILFSLSKLHFFRSSGFINIFNRFR